MAASSESLLSALVARSLIAAHTAQPLPPGNRNRRAPTHTAWRARTPAGQEIKLTLGANLAALAATLTGFAAASPGLVSAPLFHVSLPGGEALAEPFAPGRPLTVAAADPDFPSLSLVAAFTRACRLLASTENPSTPAARDAEWNDWIALLLRLDGWTEAERTALNEQVLPRLGAALRTHPPVTRWSNGDFTADNLLVTPEGESRLIDAEFAARTHFFAEDAVRFHLMSAAARRTPHLFTAALPDPGPAWQLYFWLRQWQLEQIHNTADYGAAVRTARLGVIRRLAEELLGIPLPGWSVPAQPLSFHLESARWLAATGAALRFNGWCHVPGAELRAITATAAGRRLAEVATLPRPDVQAHFSGAPLALASGFCLDLPPLDPRTPLILAALTGDGTWLPFHTVIPGDLPDRGPALGDYHAWLAHQETRTPVRAPDSGPTFSLLLPLYNTPPPLLRACLASVRRQTYPHWELCMVDDGSTTPETVPLAQEFAREDARITLTRLECNSGIARATNAALHRAGGDYIVLLDHDDLLLPHTLAELACVLVQEPELDVIYTDEDKLTPTGHRDAPAFKPGFSPEFLRGVMYVGHALCVRRPLALAAGGFDPAFDGIQDYEFLLRVTELTSRIRHLPRLLYHWRQSAGSIALHGDSKGALDAKQARAVQAHLDRTGQRRRAVAQGAHRITLLPEVSTLPPVSLLIACPASAPLPPQDGGLAPREILTGDSWPALAAAAAGEILVVLTTPPVALSPGWLARLVDVAALPDSGLAAPLLLSAEGRVFEAGWTAGPRQLAPLMRGFALPADGYNGSLACNREVAAVSAHAFAFHRRHLATLPPDGQVLPWALRLLARGHLNRVVASASVQTTYPWHWSGDDHHRDPASLPEDARPLCTRPDPYFHAAFDPGQGDYRLAFPLPPGA